LLISLCSFDINVCFSRVLDRHYISLETIFLHYAQRASTSPAIAWSSTMNYTELVQFLTECKIMIDEKKASASTTTATTTQTPEPSADKNKVEPAMSKAHWISVEDIRQLFMQATFDAVQR
jgi:hypothetical protein